jgi:hypothetical protein
MMLIDSGDGSCFAIVGVRRKKHSKIRDRFTREDNFRQAEKEYCEGKWGGGEGEVYRRETVTLTKTCNKGRRLDSLILFSRKGGRDTGEKV